MPEESVGVIGLGRIGSQYVDWLLEEGYSVTVCDIDDEKAKDAVERGAEAADTPADIAQDVDILLLSLPGNEYVETVMEGENGVLETVSEGQIVVDTGTTTPDIEAHYEQLCEERGAGYIESPLTYGGPENETGEGSPLTMFVGGKKEYYERVKGIIEVISHTHKRFGNIGKGQVMKLGDRMRQNCEAAVAAEMVEFYRNNGVDPEQAASLMNWEFRDRFLSEEYPDTQGFQSALNEENPDTSSLEENTYRLNENRVRPRLRQPSWIKDQAYALEVAYSSNTATPILSTVFQSLLGVHNYAEALAEQELRFGDGLLGGGWEGRRDIITHYRRLNRPAEEWQRLQQGEDR